jgi:hypothetical protein
MFSQLLKKSFLLLVLPVVLASSSGCSRNKNRKDLTVVKSLDSSIYIKQQHIKQEFENRWDDLYDQGWCHRNIRNFMNHLEQGRFDISEARALIIYHKKDDSFLPLNARNKVLKPWFFHVVMELDGEIYDFDFMTTPTVLPAKQYFKKILGFTSPKSNFVFKRLTPDQFRSLPNSFFMEYSRFEESTLELDWFDFTPAPGNAVP